MAAAVARLLSERRAESGERRGDPLAAWPCDVIVASGGVADAIARELGPTAGLQLQTLDELARRMVRARVATEGERRLAMRTAARSIDDPLMSTRGIAAMLERSYRDMRDSGVTLGTVKLRRQVVRTRVARVRTADRLDRRDRSGGCLFSAPRAMSPA